MLNKTFFQKLKKNHQSYDYARRDIIIASGNALKKSKQAIFSLHRNDAKTAQKLIKEVEKTFQGLEPKFKKLPKLREEGSYHAAVEEYVEAKLFSKVLAHKKIDQITEVDVATNDYLGGLCDVSGELLRKMVSFATERKNAEAKRLKKEIEDIIAELIQFNMTGYLRTKYDQAKNNLRKAEEVIYHLSLKK